MMNISKLKPYLLPILAFIAVISLVICLIIKYKNKDKFCQCNGMEHKVCVDPQVLKQLYAENKLTEYNIPPKGYGKLNNAYDGPYDTIVKS